MVYYNIHKNPPLVPILRQMNPVYAFHLLFFKIRYYNILSFMLWSFKQYLCFRFSTNSIGNKLYSHKYGYDALMYGNSCPNLMIVMSFSIKNVLSSATLVAFLFHLTCTLETAVTSCSNLMIISCSFYKSTQAHNCV
jgi:hypothetical protein